MRSFEIGIIWLFHDWTSITYKCWLDRIQVLIHKFSSALNCNGAILMPHDIHRVNLNEKWWVSMNIERLNQWPIPRIVGNLSEYIDFDVPIKQHMTSHVIKLSKCVRNDTGVVSLVLWWLNGIFLVAKLIKYIITVSMVSVLFSRT